MIGIFFRKKLNVHNTFNQLYLFRTREISL